MQFYVEVSLYAFRRDLKFLKEARDLRKQVSWPYIELGFSVGGPF